MPENIKIIQDISLLYELSLSVGSSLDPLENCHNFLHTLISRKSLSFGSIWLNRSRADGTEYCALFYIYPHFQKALTAVTCNHIIIEELSTKPYISIPSQDPRFGALIHEKKVGTGAYCLFKLGNLGHLKMFAANRPDGFDELEMAQLKQVVDKLAISLDGCFAHIHLKEETENRMVAQKALAESENKYRGILENMELGLLEIDLKGNIIRANKTFGQLLGLQPEELIGMNAIETFLPNSSKNIVQSQLSERMQGYASVYEVQFKRKNGELAWTLISGAPIKNTQGVIIGAMSLHIDITDRKEMEHELAEAKHTADRARLAERQFLTHMSHEIRTPINAVIGLTHLLFATQPNSIQLEYLNSLRFSADSLLGVIDNILDISKIDAGEIEFEQEPFDLEYLLKLLLQTFKFKVEEKDIQIFETVDPAIKNLVVGDPTRLNQILTNLLGNALKFTEKGVISLSTKLLDDSDACYLLEFKVHDTGIGIPPGKEESIFEYFKQADIQINRKFGGTGLGLTIVKQLVEMQGGSIRVESELGVGSDFIFTLRFGNSGIPVAGEQLLPPPAPPSRSLSGLHFLIVEDNLLNQKLSSKTIENWGCSFEVAKNGLEALEKTALQQFDIILMDIHMPELDGFEATMAIRNNASNPNQHTPIIALTAAAMAEEKRRAIAAGMNSFLTKPISPKILQEHLLHIIDQNPRSDRVHLAMPKEKMEDLIDLQYLISLSNGDKNFVSQIIETLAVETPAALQQLEVLAKSKAWQEAGAVAHQLKPNFGMFGLTDLQYLAEQIESCAKKKELDAVQLENLIAQLVQRTTVILQNLGTLDDATG